MKLTLYIAAAVLFLVAAVSVYMAFQSPSFVAWIITAMASGFASAVLPSLARRKSAEEEAADHQDRREAVERTISGRHREH